jgi:hypothetical protein
MKADAWEKRSLRYVYFGRGKTQLGWLHLKVTHHFEYEPWPVRLSPLQNEHFPSSYCIKELLIL